MKSIGQSNAVVGLKHILAPTFILMIVVSLVYGAGKITLPEKYLTYETFFLIFTAIVALFFMAIAVPCGLYGGYKAIIAIVCDKKYVLPVITLVLDCALLFSWVYALRHFFLS